MQDFNQQFCKEQIVKILDKMVESTHGLLLLIPESFWNNKVSFSRRTFGELVSHIAFSPKEEILLSKGLERTKIISDFKETISSAEEFKTVIDESMFFFEKELDDLDLVSFRKPFSGEHLLGFEWAVEVLTHFSNHRNQLYLAIREMGIVPPKQLIESFFPGHPPMSEENYFLLSNKKQ